MEPKSWIGRWSTLSLLLLLAVAVFFYIRAILPIQTADDRQAAGPSIGVERQEVGTESSDRQVPELGSDTPAEPGMDPRLIETPARHLPPPQAESTPAEPRLEPLPDEQLELIQRVFAPELDGKLSPPVAGEQTTADEAPSR